MNFCSLKNMSAEDRQRLEDRACRAGLAKDVLSNPVFFEAFARVERDLLTKWQSEVDSDKRDEIWHEVKLLGQLKNKLELMIKDGQTAEMSLGLNTKCSRLAKIKALWKVVF